MQRLFAIGHLFLALLLLSSSSGLVIGEHYCQGQRVKTALFRQADGCGMEKKGRMASCQLQATSRSGQTQVSQSDCCQDRIQLLRTENKQDKTSRLELLQHPTVLLPAPALMSTDEPLVGFYRFTATHLPKGPPPPKPGRHNLPAFTQSFLF